ncbi:WASH complex subunit 4 [Aethina tumida]|uniref:WASH complex subunit 4 n=1 Tax=Aethina tumida TaxID=116153 RepID=UPI00214822D3|nr:WASH complex subunit 4 [Aethina tumida]
MWEPSNITEKKLNSETHKIIAENQLRKYKAFLDKYVEDTSSYEKKLSNTNNVTYKPIILTVEATECIPILHLVHSDNKILSKILGSLAAICEEINLLAKESESLYNDFVLYGNEEGGSNIENIESVSKVIDSLQKALSFVERCQQVAILLLKQLSCILGKGYYTTTSTCNFTEMLNHFSKLLVCLVTLEALFENQALQEHLILYRKCVRNMLHNSKYNISKENIKLFEKVIVRIQNELMSSRIFKDTLECFLEDKLIGVLKNCSLNAEFIAYINCILYDFERDEDNISNNQMWMQLNVITVFSMYIFGNVDKKIIRRIFEINKKISACNLVGNIMWYPEAFFLKHVQTVNKFIDEKSIDIHRIQHITNKYQALSKDSQLILAQACCLMIDIERVTKKRYLQPSNLQEICNLFLDTLKFTHKLNAQIRLLINIHTEKPITMTKSVLSSLCKFIELLKGIELLFVRNYSALSNLLIMLTQQLSYKALTILQNIRKNCTQEKSYKEHQLDVLSSLNVCEHSLKGPNTSQRFIIANLALSASGLPTDTLFSLRLAIHQLEVISYFEKFLNNYCDASFIYWHQLYLLPVYYSKLMSTKCNIARCYLILSALTDCSSLCDKEKLREKNDSELKLNVTTPLNQIVETNLRLQTHQHLELPPFDPIQNYFPLNFYKFLPSAINHQYKNIKCETEHYLSGMFYNLTTVVLHNWKTYGEMRRLALLQYGLETVDDNLPMQTLEQGLDVLEIMRNINVFVSKYLYNLNTQVFIEESSNNKHLNTINISHVANSIRTHGLGIMNTTVNFTYQYLRTQFYIFSQFMFDEHIKSRLLKDLRFFAEHKNEFNQMYPYERAEKFHFGIRKLGLNQNGQSYLDLFRKVITHIGNAMGYVRLIRSGGRRCLADGTCFIPDLKGIDELKTLLDDNNLPELSKVAADGVKNDLDNFVESFEEATEYFKLLVKVFVPSVRNKNNVHLKNFYIIVPPLTINFIEHSLSNKDRLNKKNKTECAFTDDGFALGLAYIIELLDQESQLSSLHWFHSIQRKFKNDRLKLDKQRASSVNDNTKLKETLSLTEKRISTFEKEFQLLYYSFNSARLFFQS